MSYKIVFESGKIKGDETFLLFSIVQSGEELVSGDVLIEDIEYGDLFHTHKRATVSVPLVESLDIIQFTDIMDKTIQEGFGKYYHVFYKFKEEDPDIFLKKIQFFAERPEICGYVDWYDTVQVDFDLPVPISTDPFYSDMVIDTDDWAEAFDHPKNRNKIYVDSDKMLFKSNIGAQRISLCCYAGESRILWEHVLVHDNVITFYYPFFAERRDDESRSKLWKQLVRGFAKRGYRVRVLCANYHLTDNTWLVKCPKHEQHTRSLSLVINFIPPTKCWRTFARAQARIIAQINDLWRNRDYCQHEFEQFDHTRRYETDLVIAPSVISGGNFNFYSGQGHSTTDVSVETHRGQDFGVSKSPEIKVKIGMSGDITCVKPIFRKLKDFFKEEEFGVAVNVEIIAGTSARRRCGGKELSEEIASKRICIKNDKSLFESSGIKSLPCRYPYVNYINKSDKVVYLSGITGNTGELTFHYGSRQPITSSYFVCGGTLHLVNPECSIRHLGNTQVFKDFLAVLSKTDFCYGKYPPNNIIIELTSKTTMCERTRRIVRGWDLPVCPVIINRFVYQYKPQKEQ